ncbi:MAG: hypothetical protein ACKO3R_04400 [bacterium]
MFLGLLKNIPILNSFVGKPAASQESSEAETEAAAKANEKAIAQEGLKPLFIVALPEGDFSELKAKLKEKFNGRDLHFEVDPELKKPKLYILKPNALAKRNLETALDKAFIKDNYRSIELSGDGNKLGESLIRTMKTELVSLKGAEKAKLRESLESLSKLGVHIHDDNCGCGQAHGEGTGDGEIKFSKTETRTADFSINTKRHKSLIDFFTALRKSTETNHNEFIKKSNEVYIIRDPRTNPDEELDWQKCNLIIAKKAVINGLPNFNIYEMKLSDFLEGGDLPSQSQTMKIHQVHSKSHEGFEAAPSLSILTHLGNLTKEHLKTAVQEQFQNNLKKTCTEINEHIEKTTSTKNTLSIKTSLFTNDFLLKENTFKANIQSLLQMISSPENQENFKDLDWESAGKYRDTRIKIAAQPNVHELLNSSNTHKDSPEETNRKKAQLEQSDPISQKINRELAQRDDFKNSKDPKTGKEEHDKQVGGIALTGQFSFIDRKAFHEKNETYKDFPPLPEHWKTEPHSPNATTDEIQTNHDPANNTPQDIAQPTETITETITPHTTKATTNHQSEPVNPA